MVFSLKLTCFLLKFVARFLTGVVTPGVAIAVWPLVLLFLKDGNAVTMATVTVGTISLVATLNWQVHELLRGAHAHLTHIIDNIL